jgi:hypothetical protein
VHRRSGHGSCLRPPAPPRRPGARNGRVARLLQKLERRLAREGRLAAPQQGVQRGAHLRELRVRREADVRPGAEKLHAAAGVGRIHHQHRERSGQPAHLADQRGGIAVRDVGAHHQRLRGPGAQPLAQRGGGAGGLGGVAFAVQARGQLQRAQLEGVHHRHAPAPPVADPWRSRCAKTRRRTLTTSGSKALPAWRCSSSTTLAAPERPSPSSAAAARATASTRAGKGSAPRAGRRGSRAVPALVLVRQRLAGGLGKRDAGKQLQSDGQVAPRLAVGAAQVAQQRRQPERVLLRRAQPQLATQRLHQEAAQAALGAHHRPVALQQPHQHLGQRRGGRPASEASCAWAASWADAFADGVLTETATSSATSGAETGRGAGLGMMFLAIRVWRVCDEAGRPAAGMRRGTSRWPHAAA